MNLEIKKLLIALILIFSFIVLGSTEVHASAPTISVNSPEVGSDLKITIVFGSDVCSYEGNLKVIFKNGTEYEFGKIGSYEGAAGFTRNISFSTKATVEGAGTVQLYNLELGDSSYNPLPVGTTFGAGFTVKAKQAATTPTTNTTTTPTQPSTPTTNTTTPSKPATNTTTTPSTPTQPSTPTLNNVSTGSTYAIYSDKECKNVVSKQGDVKEIPIGDGIVYYYIR